MAARLHSHVISLLLLLVLPAATATTYSSLCHFPTAARDNGLTVSPLPLPWISSGGHFSGGGGLNFAPDHDHNRVFSLVCRGSSGAATVDPTITHLSATLTLEGARRHDVHSHHSVSFTLIGYYYSSPTNATAELCMVGTGDDGSDAVVLRLSVPRPSSLARPFVTGILEGVDFNRTSLVAYAEDGYAYGQAASCPAEAPHGASRQVLNAGFSCSRLRALLGGLYSVEYMPSDGSGGLSLRLRHGSMYVNQVHCDAHGAVRAYMTFFAGQADAFPSNYYWERRWARGFGDEALVADGFWDSSRSRLCLKACRVARTSGASGTEDLGVGECGIGVSFWFPAVWSIRDRSVATGMIWNASSNSDGNTSAGVISVSRTWSYNMDISGIKYNYTRVQEAKKHYDSMSPTTTYRKGSRFPGNYSYRDFAFEFQGQRFYGYASPVTIGSALVEGDELTAGAAFQAEEVKNKQRLLNVSYTLRYERTHVLNSPRLRHISAEGVYDTKTGALCMVACQVMSNVSPEPDCEVLVTVQFAPMDGVARQRAVGTISSLRDQNDPLFFEPLDFVGDRMYVIDMAESMSRMAMESVMLLASMVLSCVFTALQLRHVKRHPEALPATSVTMLIILALSYVVPVVLSLEDMYKNSLKHYLDKLTSGGLLELDVFMQSVSTMLALALLLRLLQLTLLSRRSTDQAASKHDDSSSSSASSSSSSSSFDAERSTLRICLPLYAFGAVAVCIAHLIDGHKGPFALPGPGIMDDIAAYAGLVLDGFLLPQVIWNVYAGSTVRALSPWFYGGGTVIRAAPHVYDAFRKGSYVASRRPSFVYASPRDGLFGVGWDVAIPCGAALLGAVVFLQQRLGGAFLCDLKRRWPGGYKMVSTLSS